MRRQERKRKKKKKSANTKVRCPYGGPYAGAGGYALKEPQPVENSPWSRFILKDSHWRWGKVSRKTAMS